MTRKHYIVGTAGHIDHGKSTLVEALTGTDPDRLPEEKARGMTIDLGFAHMAIPDPDQPDVTYDLGVVDVPGHADFVKNMVAGVGSIDLALLVIAVDDTWMPQTEEHAQILTYLGIRSAVVALTKSDLVDDPSESVDAVRLQLLDTPFAEAPIVPVSAIGGQGLDDLRRTLARELAKTPEPADVGKPRLHVDRAFTVKGIGTVVTGTLSGGCLRKGEAAVLQPGNLKTTVRNIQSHSAGVETARPGMRTALNLSDLTIDDAGKRGVRRGDVVTLAKLGEATRVLDAHVTRVAREVEGQPVTKRPIKSGQRIRWHHGGGSHSGRIYFLGHRSLHPGEAGFAQIRLEQPAFAFVGDRFVIRDWPKTSSLAGGVVLDLHGSRERFRGEAQSAFLRVRAEEPNDVTVALGTLLERDKAVPASGLLMQSRFEEAEVAQTLERLRAAGRVEQAGAWLVDKVWWDSFVKNAGAAIDRHHEEHKDQPGKPLADLRQEFAPALPNAQLFDALLETLAQGDYTRAGGWVRNRKHLPQLPPDLRAAGDRIRKALAANPLEPPNPKELAPTAGDQKALRFLVQVGEAVDLGDKCVLLAEVFDKVRAGVIDYLKKHQKGTVSELRQEIGTTRRVLMPVLDKLDRDGVTVRNEDFRSLSRAYLRQLGSDGVT